jgi:hypothetical protein
LALVAGEQINGGLDVVGVSAARFVAKRSCPLSPLLAAEEVVGRRACGCRFVQLELLPERDNFAPSAPCPFWPARSALFNLVCVLAAAPPSPSIPALSTRLHLHRGAVPGAMASAKALPGWHLSDLISCDRPDLCSSRPSVISEEGGGNGFRNNFLSSGTVRSPLVSWSDEFRRFRCMSIRTVWEHPGTMGRGRPSCLPHARNCR